MFGFIGNGSEIVRMWLRFPSRSTWIGYILSRTEADQVFFVFWCFFERSGDGSWADRVCVRGALEIHYFFINISMCRLVIKKQALLTLEMFQCHIFRIGQGVQFTLTKNTDFTLQRPFDDLPSYFNLNFNCNINEIHQSQLPRYIFHTNEYVINIVVRHKNDSTETHQWESLSKCTESHD